MDTNQFVEEIWFQGPANTIQSNLFQRAGKCCASSAGFDGEDALLFQGADNIPDDDRIDARRTGQHLTCHLHPFSVLGNNYETMDGNGAFGTYVHNQVPPISNRLP